MIDRTTIGRFRTPPRRVAGLWLAATVAGCQGTIASAQSTVRLPPQGDIARQRVAPLPLPPVDYDFRIQNPERSAVPRAVDEIEFSVRSIRVVGAKHFPDSVVRSIFAPIEGRTIVLEDLRKAAQQLEDRYRAEGYFLTRVFVSPQQVKDGVLEVQVLEGYIAAAFVEAPNAPSRQHVERLLKPVIDQHPAQFRDLESRLLLINDIPGLAGNSVLRQGAEPGSSEMLVNLSRVPNAYRASFSNTASDILGPTSYGLGATLSQPLGRPGLLDVDLSASGGNLSELRSANLRYAAPVGSGGAVLALGGLVAFAKPGGVVASLGIKSRIMSFNSRLRVPLLRSRENSVYADFAMTVNRSRTEVKGEPLVQDKGTVAEIGLSWQQVGWLNGATTVTLTLSRGLEIFGAIGRSASKPADPNAPLPSAPGFKPDFTKLNYSLQRTQILTNRITAQFNVQGQYTGDRLLSGEQVSFGGPSIGRGYDPSLLAGERGLGMVGELQYDLPVKLAPATDSAKLYSFADWARATTLAYQAMPKQNRYISSIGVGVRTVLWQHASVDMQLARAVRTVAGDPRRGVRFNLNVFLFW
jgi:hemolysin activation/secretion protein